MAGVHQLWAFDPADGTVAVAAGTTNEGLVGRAVPVPEVEQAGADRGVHRTGFT